MAKVIIYPQKNGPIAIITPILDSGLTVEQIAKKDVPDGVPYLIIDESEVPSDFSFRDAWEADFSNPHGRGMGNERWFFENPSPVFTREDFNS